MDKVISCRVSDSLYLLLEEIARLQDRKKAYLIKKFVEAGISQYFTSPEGDVIEVRPRMSRTAIYPVLDEKA